VKAEDFEVEDERDARLKGGFHYGKSRTGIVYIPPRPLMNHGPHRCKWNATHPNSAAVKAADRLPPDFFQVVALSEPLDKALLKKQASRDEIAEAIRGKVLGWGMWTGVAERKWS
jgi:phosphatidylethanolamine-binding protein (PEBP) family uncharacterized protein